jgi:hypothetical protein
VRAGEIQFCVPDRTACRECFASFRKIDNVPHGRDAELQVDDAVPGTAR